MKKIPLRILPWELVKKLWPTISKLSKRDQYTLIRSRGFYDKEFFAQHIVPRWTQDKQTGIRYPSARFHVEVWKQTSLDESVVLVAPRNHAKTTVLKIDMTHALCYRLQVSILLLASEGLGKDIVADIRMELDENPLIKLLFGNLVPSGRQDEGESNHRWQGTKIELLNGCSLECISFKGRVRGKRPTRIYVDDPQEKKDVKNPQIVRDFWDWFWQTVYPAKNVGRSSVIVTGTIISDNCFVNELAKNAEAKGFKLIQYQAVKNFETKGFDGELLWPERWTRELLEKEYNAMSSNGADPGDWLQEYQHIPKPINATYIFHRLERLTVLDYIKKLDSGIQIFADIYNQELRRLWKYVFFGIDLAKGGPNDYTSIIARNEKGELLAEFYGWVTQDKAAEILDEMIRTLVGDNYNNISYAPEINDSDLFMSKAREYDWFDRITHRDVFDKLTKSKVKKPGFRTTNSSKKILVYEIQSHIDGDTGLQVSAKQKEELEKFINNEEGGMEAMSPYHDDSVIGNGLSLYCISQGMPADPTKIF